MQSNIDRACGKDSPKDVVQSSQVVTVPMYAITATDLSTERLLATESDTSRQREEEGDGAFVFAAPIDGQSVEPLASTSIEAVVVPEHTSTNNLQPSAPPPF